MQDIELKLTLDEINLVLEGLGDLAYARVFGLVTKIQSQAAEQIRAAQVEAAGATGGGAAKAG